MHCVVSGCAGAGAASAARGAPLRHGVVVLADGLLLPYAEAGGPQGVPLVLLHGYAESWRSFEAVLPHFPPTIRAIAPTLRGHGDAGRPRSGYTARHFADDLARFLDARGIRSAVVAGHSLGGFVAQRFALDHPDRVTGLALAGTATTACGNPALIELWSGAVSGLDDPIDEAFVRAFHESALARPIPPAQLDRAVEESLKAPARVWRAVLGGLLQADHSAELRRIGRPALLICGARDARFPRWEQAALGVALPHARQLVYADAGHGLHREEPERFARDLTGFVGAVTAGQ